MARYDWSPAFDALNNAIAQNGMRNQYTAMLNALAPQPQISPAMQSDLAAAQPFPAQAQRLQAAVPQPKPDPTMAMLRGMPPALGMQFLPLLLKKQLEGDEYDTTPRVGINPASGKREMFVQDKRGNTKWLGTAPETKAEFVNGQAVNPYDIAPGTVIPKQNNPNEPFNADGTPNKAYQAWEMNKLRTQQAPQWANVDIARQNLELKKGGALDDSTVEFMANQILAGDRSPFQNLGRGAQGAQNIVRLRQAVSNLARARNLGGADLAALNAEFAGLQAGERTLGTRTANIEMAASEVQQLAPLALAASNAVDRSRYPSLNALELAIKKGTGDEATVRFSQANNALINTYARAVSPSGTPTVSDKEHAREILETAYSKGQYAAAIDQMQKEIAAARRSPASVRGEFRGAISGRQGMEAAVPDAPGTQPAAGGWSIKLKGQ